MKKMRIVVLIMIFLSVVLSISCEKHGCIKSSGKPAKEIRHLSGFDKIQIYNYYKVYLKTDSINKIEIEAGENLLKNIETEIKDSTLIIRDLNACRFMKGYDAKKLYISARELKKIVIEDGVELLSIDTLKLDKFYLRYYSDIGSCNLTVNCQLLYFDVWYGTGNYVFSGKTKSLYLAMEAVSHADASMLEADYVQARNNSLGDIYVNVTKRLYAKIRNDGNIYYKGNPSLVKLTDSIGNGKLIHYED